MTGVDALSTPGGREVLVQLLQNACFDLAFESLGQQTEKLDLDVDVGVVYLKARFEALAMGAGTSAVCTEVDVADVLRVPAIEVVDNRFDP